MEYQFDEKGSPITPAERDNSSGGAAPVRTYVALGMLVVGLYLAFQVVHAAYGLLNNDPPPVLLAITGKVESAVGPTVADTVADSVADAVQSATADNRSFDLRIPPELFRAAAYLLCVMMLWIPAGIASSLIRWSAHLLRAETSR
ncbi:MAG: hypothetical protein KDB14_15620 [Planctomycetales bacterium]|nr:hypothetical protein [Planctomycetales bacterium]